MGNIFQISKINGKQTINTNRWSIKFVGLGSLLDQASSTKKLPGIHDRYNAVKEALGSGVTDIATNLELSLFSCQLPQVQLETQSIARFNDTIKTVTKFGEMEDMNVTFIDYVDGSASAIMQLWHSFVGDKKTGAIGFKEDYILPKAYFFVYGPDAPGYDDTYVEQKGVPWLQCYEIVNLFPKSINLGEHSDAADARKVEITFALDNIYPIGIHTYKTKDGAITTPQDRYSDSTGDIIGDILKKIEPKTP